MKKLLQRVYFYFNRAYNWVFRPKTRGARVILVSKSSVCLIRHRYGQNLWYLPGAGAKRRESSEECSRRELKHETGITCFELREFGEYENTFESRKDKVKVLTAKVLESAIDMTECIIYGFDSIPSGVTNGTRCRISEYRTDENIYYFGRWGEVAI